MPVIQIGLTSDKLSEQQIFDYGNNLIRTQIGHRAGRGAAVPLRRQAAADLRRYRFPALQAKGLSPTDVVNAVSAQNLVLPSGTVKLGPTEYNVEMNGAPHTIEELNNLPIKTVNGATIYMRDVATSATDSLRRPTSSAWTASAAC